MSWQSMTACYNKSIGLNKVFFLKLIIPLKNLSNFCEYLLYYFTVEKIEFCWLKNECKKNVDF